MPTPRPLCDDEYSRAIRREVLESRIAVQVARLRVLAAQTAVGWERALLPGPRRGRGSCQEVATASIFLAIKFDRVLPVVACGAFHPEFDFQGNRLERLGRRVDFDHITLTVTAFGSSDGPAGALADSYLEIEDDRISCSSRPITCLFDQAGGTPLLDDDQNAFNVLTKRNDGAHAHWPRPS
jgi:hypothetical protein